MSPPSHHSAALPSSAPPCALAPDTRAKPDRWYADEIKPHEPALRAYLHRRYPTLSDVDDIVQDTLLRSFLAWRQGKVTSKGFLYTIASNLTVSLFRRRKFVAATPVNELPALRVLEDDADVVEAVCSSDELALVSEAIARLPERCRQVVILRLFHQEESGAIAGKLGMSEVTVRVQLARGMKKCSEYLRERGVTRDFS